MSNNVERITIQLRAPPGTDAGKIAIGYYVVNPDNDVLLCDESGKPIADERHHLGPGGDAKLIACMMFKRREKANASHASFSGPINYPKIGF